MDKEKLNSFLDNIYELEGLVHLALSRDDEPTSLSSLIARKGKELAARAELIGGVVASETASEPKEEDVRNDNGEDIEDEAEEALFEETSEAFPEDISEDKSDEKLSVQNDTDTSEPRGRLVFSVNDRYRFKRGLFGNSDVEFNTTMALVASMENYEEAEDYFLGELQLDAANQEVIDFLEIIRNYFK